MPKPPGALVVKWRDMAEEGQSYAEIQRQFPDYTPDQVRHYCMGHAGKKLPGPIQPAGRWNGSNVWLRGERSPHAELTESQARRILDDWDEERDRWGTAGAEWAERFGVSPSTVYMLRRGETWEHLKHPNQGKSPRRKKAS
jgi:hypothetical protein